MKFKTYRDVSGLLVLISGKLKKICKAYVQIEIKLEINFADTISYRDYVQAKKTFIPNVKHLKIFVILMMR